MPLSWYLSRTSFMTINFGNIKSYNSDRGFGFVGRAFFNPTGEVFFHIKKIKEKYPELAYKLDNSKTFENINFWYEIETNHKREQVSKLWLNIADIPQSYKNELYDLTKKVESIWKDVSSLKPSWLNPLTIELVGVERRHELSFERDNLESQLRLAEEVRCREAAALHQNKIRRIVEMRGLTKVRAEELLQLLAEMYPLNFKESSDLSKYILKHKLGYKYPNISGIVRMKEEDTEWNFLGGFPPDIYKIVCEELNLSNRGTSARAVKFTPFKDINETNKN